MRRPVRLEYMIDSRSLFNDVAKDRNTSGKHLQIEVLALRQSYGGAELERISLIQSIQTLSEFLTMPVLSTSSP